MLEEIHAYYKQDVIDFNWEPIRKQPKRYGILYPIIGYIVSLLAIIFMGLGVFMWLFLVGGSTSSLAEFIVQMGSLGNIEK